MIVPDASEEVIGESELAATESACEHGQPARFRRARLLKRVYKLDLEQFRNCDGQLKIIAAMRETAAIKADRDALRNCKPEYHRENRHAG